MKKLISIVTLLLLFTSYSSTTVAMSEAKLTEAQKIEQLYNYLNSLKDVQFYRNGSYYNVTDAVNHLKMKQGKVGTRIKTARDFINMVATKSSMTDEAYKIRYADKKEVPLQQVLLKKLEEIEAVK